MIATGWTSFMVAVLMRWPKSGNDRAASRPCYKSVQPSSFFSPTSHYGSGNSTKGVVLVNSIEPIVLVCVMFHGSERQSRDRTAYPIWAVFDEHLILFLRPKLLMRRLFPRLYCLAWPTLTTVAAIRESIGQILANRKLCDTSGTTRGRLSLNLRSSLGRRITSRPRSHEGRGSPLSALRQAVVTSSSPFFRRSHATPHPKLRAPGSP
jgi:hypothetical protein